MRSEKEHERQWPLAEAQQGLVQMGSKKAVEDLVAEGQRAADKSTSERFAQMAKDQENTMKLLAKEKQRTAEYTRDTLKRGERQQEVDFAALLSSRHCQVARLFENPGSHIELKLLMVIKQWGSRRVLRRDPRVGYMCRIYSSTINDTCGNKRHFGL